MNIIRISTDNEISVHEFPDWSYDRQNEVLRTLIGNNCRIYERVMPERLYTELHMTARLSNVPGRSVSMLADEEGRLKENEPNLVGSYIYKTDQHGCPIMGNILFVGDFCGIEDSVFELLVLELKNLIFTMEATKEALDK